MFEEAQGVEMSILCGVTALGEVDQRKVCTPVLSTEILQQRLRLLQVLRVKPFDE